MLSSKWLGQPPPEIYSTENSFTPSQRKYLDIILAWSSWEDFQRLLATLEDIALVHSVSLTIVATKWVLQQNTVGSVIVGTRLGVSNRQDENLKVFGWSLSGEELQRINDAALGLQNEKCDSLWQRLGDCGDEYRSMY